MPNPIFPRSSLGRQTPPPKLTIVEDPNPYNSLGKEAEARYGLSDVGAAFVVHFHGGIVMSTYWCLISPPFMVIVGLRCLIFHKTRPDVDVSN